jgi:EAL domain-containing protein (putative c-di-GMP-specific phosphodiesterase class I)
MMLLYQPIFSLSTGEMVGTEALIRWLHPVRGLLSPASFIEIAESSCLIVPIGRWVIETAIKQATLISNNMKISINLSPLQVDDPGLVMCISNALKEYKMPASRVELEITETVMLGRDTHTVETLSAIRSLGVNFALDDFGTGYSSLILLRDFRFDRIKVDRSFITTMLTDKMSQILVEQIVDLAYKMDTRLTIEGVETIQQADYLRQYQNVDIQGYLYGKPMTFEKIMETERNFLTNT